MAKGNFLTSQVRGKLGDVVFYRQDGEQVSRSRNRHPHNPKTVPQLYQRAILGTVTGVYKVGKEIFDHSFEGYSVGAHNQREFIRRNTKLLRSLVATDLNNNRTGDDAVGRVMGPGTASPVGFAGLIVSAGTYPMQAFTFTPIDREAQDPAQWLLPVAVTDETRSAYAARVGLIADDIYTFVMLYSDSDTDEIVYRVNSVTGAWGALQYREHFAFLRLRVRADFVASTVAMTDVKLSDIFVFDTYSPDIDVATLSAQAFGSELTLDGIVTAPGGAEGYIALIRSRLDSDLRSNSAMVIASPSTALGITSEWILPAWQQGTEAVGNSELILEGGGF